MTVPGTGAHGDRAHGRAGANGLIVKIYRRSGTGGLFHHRLQRSKKEDSRRVLAAQPQVVYQRPRHNGVGLVGKFDYQ